MQELDNIKNGESWVGFSNLPDKYNRKAMKHNRPVEEVKPPEEETVITPEMKEMMDEAEEKKAIA